MEEATRTTVTVREGDRFDDEITLPLRIICERKTDVIEANRREPSAAQDARGREADRKPIRAA